MPTLRMVSLLTASTLVACQPGPSSSPGSAPPAIEAENRQSLAAWVEAFRRDDERAMAQVWAPDLIGWAPGERPYTYADVEKNLAAAPRPGRVRTDVALSIEEIIVRWL